MNTDSAKTTDAATTGGNLYVLDTHGMVFQMFFAIDKSLKAPDGLRHTNAVMGVTRAVMDLYDHGADYLLATFDRPEPTFRDALYPKYKAQRPETPPELIQQIPMIYDVLRAMRIPILSQPGYEADDILATLAHEGEARGLTVHLCSSDKDCRQLLSDRVTIRNLRKGETLDAEGLMKLWGVTPKQVVDFQALVGDAVDNVPGVPGCGPKTAAKWLQQYGTLDNLAAHADEVGGPKLRDALKTAIADGSLELSRRLVRLDSSVPIEFDWVGWKRRDWNGEALLALFQEYGFNSLANRVRSTLVKSGAKQNETMLETAGLDSTRIEAAAETKSGPASRSKAKGKAKAPQVPRPGQASLFDQLDGTDEPAAEPPAKPATDWNGTYTLIDTQPAFETFLAELRQQTRFTFDLETTGLDPLQAEIVGYAFCWKETEAYYLAVRGPEGAALLDPEKTLAALKPIFENPAVAKVNQNIKYERLMLRAAGVTLRGIAGDPMLADYLLRSGERSHNLDDLARRLLGHENISITSLIGVGKKQITMDRVPTEKVAEYAGEDADVAFRLGNLLEAELDADPTRAPARATVSGDGRSELRALYDDLELPLIEVLAELEFNGIRLDVNFLKSLSVEMEQQLTTIESTIHTLAGRKLNIASPKQLRVLLFDEMKLPVQKRTGTTNEPSTDQESLERLAALGHDLPKAIIEHRQVAKLKGTYVDALPALVNPKTGRLHTSFNQTVATTGRLSSSDPNLQNIPARTEMGRQIRQAFLPREGWVLITADYSQVELRLLAHFCEDEQLQRAFAEDKDIHTIVAAQIFKVSEDDVTSEQRRVAKTVNFGIIYGMSASGLATRLSIPRKEAATFIDDYFARYPKVMAYQNRLLADAKRTGSVRTLLGRRRNFDPIGIREHPSYENRSQAEREAINMEIQGSAADLMKLAMIGVYNRLHAEKRQAKLLLTVHDELVLEAPPDEVAAITAVVREEMSGAMTLAVPLKVDVAVGPNWLDVEEVSCQP